MRFSFVVLVLVACSKPPASVHEGPVVVVIPADPARSEPIRRAPLTLRVERNDTRFDVSGEVPLGELPPLLAARAKDYAVTHINLKQLVDPSADEQTAYALLGDAALRLWGGTLDLRGPTLEVHGKVRSDDDKAAMEAALGAAARLLHVETTLDITVDLERWGHGEGFLRRSDGGPIAALKLVLTPVEGGPPVTPDAAGRVVQGLYTVTLGMRETTIAVNEGKVTWLPFEQSTSKGVLIGGRRFGLDLDVPLIAPGDEGAFDATSIDAKDDQPLFGDRFREPGKRLPVSDILANRQDVRQVILHAHGRPDAATDFAALVGDRLSTHFLIDWDGTIYQTLDVGFAAYHAGDANMRGIGVDLEGLLDNLHARPNAPAYPKKHPRLAEMNAPAYARRPGPPAVINGVTVQTHTFTDAQYRSLGSLLRLLAGVFPSVDAGPPMIDEQVTPSALTHREDHHGVIAHWHLDAQVYDPGPSFEWTRLGLRSPPR